MKIHNVSLYIAGWRVGWYIREVFLIDKVRANGAVTNPPSSIQTTMKTMSAIVRSEICNIPYHLHMNFIQAEIVKREQ